MNEALSSSSTRNGGLAEIDFQIIWSRLIAVVEEQAQALRRTAFSPIVRESGDLSAGFFDSKGRMIAREDIRTARGSFSAVMTIDGYEGPVTLCAQLTIDAEGLGVDFSGTSGASARGINVPIAYTQAYTAFGLACAIFPHVPNNSGTLSVMRITAPEGCILNAQRPAPVSSRHVVGQMLPDVVFGCLARVIPDRVLAEGASSLWNLILEDAHDACLSQGIGATQRFSALSVQTGGTGARSSLDGLSATAFPSGVAGVPVEIIETITPLIFWRKEFREGSGGRGRHIGYLGQVIEIGHRDGHPFERHLHEALAAASAGKHVLCEKPLALEPDEAEQMVETCKRAGVVLGTNHHLRNMESHRAIKRLIDEGAIGKVTSIRVSHAGQLPAELKTWQLFKKSAGAGAIFNRTVYDADLLRYYLGRNPIRMWIGSARRDKSEITLIC